MSVEVSLSKTHLTPTAPDELAVALRGGLRRRCVHVCMNGPMLGTSVQCFEWPLVRKALCVNAVRLFCGVAQPSEMEVESQVHLYGHTGEVTGLFVCKPYSILISVSQDGTCILWDLNR